MADAKLKKITAKQAKIILERNGYCFPEGDGRTFFATDEDETEVYEYDRKADRDKACEA